MYIYLGLLKSVVAAFNIPYSSRDTTNFHSTLDIVYYLIYTNEKEEHSFAVFDVN